MEEIESEDKLEAAEQIKNFEELLESYRRGMVA